jgi:putative membrane protein
VSLVPWTAHPEVWMLLAGALALGWYAAKVLQPKAVAAGYEPITRAQKVWFTLGFVGIWVASDWPVHDIAEDHLYSVHMLQHLLLSMLLPAAFVLATPRWLIELLIDPQGRLWAGLRKATRPLVAGLIFNALTLFLHWSKIVQLSADIGPVHFGFHLAVFTAGLLMWMPVLSPISEWRLAPLGQCIYLFSMSIVPTVPGGWLVFAEGVVYRHYDTPDRLWGIDVLSDQQAAGAVMKLVGGLVLWVIIVTIFTKWAVAETDRDRVDQRARDLERLAAHDRAADERELARVSSAESAPGVAEEPLTFEAVSEAFAASTPPRET